MSHSSAAVFAALGDETRLELIKRLSAWGPQSVSQLARDTPVTRQAIAKHLAVLSDAGLVRGTRHGRERIYELRSRRLAIARRYLEEVSHRWDHALARLKGFVED